MYLSYMQQKTRLEPALRAGIISRIIFTPQTPERGEWGRFVRVIASNEKSSPFGLLLRLSGKRDSSPRCARTIIANLYLHPRPPERGEWGRFVQIIVSNEKSSPLGLLLRLNGKREFNLCSPIILSAKILRFFRFTFEFPSNSFDRFSGTDIAVLCPA